MERRLREGVIRMSGLTAIDILIDPDAEAMKRARDVNSRLLESVPLPDGWALDDTHQPHITTLQRYVRTADLDRVHDAVGRTIAATDLAALSYRAVRITHADWGFPGIAPTVLTVEVNDAVLDFQASLLTAISPFVESGGTTAAFVADPGEEISPTIVDWVERFVPDQIGAGGYFPHLTVGVATFADLERIEAEPFEAFAVHPASVAVYALGNNGTARRLLKKWPGTG
jgi:hypothetical protein